MEDRIDEALEYWDQTQQLYQAVENDKIQTGLDRQSTASDREIVTADRIQVEIYANDSQQSANNAELYKTQSYFYIGRIDRLQTRRGSKTCYHGCVLL